MARTQDAGDEEQEPGMLAETVESITNAGESKAGRKALRAERKAAKRAAKHGQEPRLTAKKASNAISVGKVVLPAVLPVVMPYAVRAANAAREAYDRHKARKLGVNVESLGEYGGRGAALHARIAGLSDSLADVRATGDAAKVRFADETGPTLQQLSAAVRASERMPAARRKQAHQAISGELDGLEARLLQHLGV